VTDRICVAVARQRLDDALMVAAQVASQADVIEIRLDYLQEIRVSPFFTALKQPLLFTNRPIWEGGRFAGTEEVRIAPLAEAAAEQAAFIDLELMAPVASLHFLHTRIEQSSTKLILSWHNFKQTPTRPELLAHLKAMQDNGADIGKIVTHAHDFHDVLRVLQLQEDAHQMHFPLIAFCMGRSGCISRLATMELGGYMTYCSANNDDITAPGQLSVTAMRQIITCMQG
jgi:3-dehydroquinate dehydratase I